MGVVTSVRQDWVTCADSRDYILPCNPCTTTADFGAYRMPTHNSTCTYCGTRWYLTKGERMNCTQCGAPLK